jgi:hypothetical protein
MYFTDKISKPSEGQELKFVFILEAFTDIKLKKLLKTSLPPARQEPAKVGFGDLVTKMLGKNVRGNICN